MSKKFFTIAIDGPAGAGKSTIAKKIAKELNIIYVDTGAMYRAMGIYFHRQGIRPEDEASIAQAVDGAHVTIAYENGQQQVYLNGENVTAYLRTEEAGHMASATSVHAVVRRKLVELQQQMAAENDVIMDGRDIGTAVFPEAELKIFVTASAEIRAQRRYDELKAKGQEASFEEILANVKERDHIDMTREVSPLRQAEDAIPLDNSHLTIEEQKQWLQEQFQKAING